MIVLGDEHIGPCPSMHLGTQFSLGMHGIQAENPSFDQGRREPLLEGTDLVLFLTDGAVPQPRASGDIITVEQMHGMGLGAGGAKGLSIDGQLPMIALASAGLQPTGLGATALLGFPPNEEGC